MEPTINISVEEYNRLTEVSNDFRRVLCSVVSGISVKYERFNQDHEHEIGCSFFDFKKEIDDFISRYPILKNTTDKYSDDPDIRDMAIRYMDMMTADSYKKYFEWCLKQKEQP